MILDTWLVLNSFDFIANGMYTLDIRRLVLPFFYTSHGLTGATMWKETTTRTTTALPIED